jgi:hypothetical protein
MAREWFSHPLNFFFLNEGVVRPLSKPFFVSQGGGPATSLFFFFFFFLKKIFEDFFSFNFFLIYKTIKILLIGTNGVQETWTE